MTFGFSAVRREDRLVRFAKTAVPTSFSQFCCLPPEVTGKYFKDDAETKSSEESLNEENQKKLWEISAGYCKLEGRRQKRSFYVERNQRR